MKQKFTASSWQEDEWFVAQCFEVGVASQGKTENEAVDNLRDALELHFHPTGCDTIVCYSASTKVDMIPLRGVRW